MVLTNPTCPKKGSMCFSHWNLELQKMLTNTQIHHLLNNYVTLLKWMAFCKINMLRWLQSWDEQPSKIIQFPKCPITSIWDNLIPWKGIQSLCKEKACQNFDKFGHICKELWQRSPMYSNVFAIFLKKDGKPNFHNANFWNGLDLIKIYPRASGLSKVQTKDNWVCNGQ
jgi:hypothetical protein